MVLTRNQADLQSRIFSVWNRKPAYSDGAITKLNQRPALKSKLATNTFLAQTLVKAYTDKMLEKELDGDVIVSSKKEPVQIAPLLKWLFPQRATRYSIDTIYTALKRKVQAKFHFSNEEWWGKWLKILSVLDFDEYLLGDEESDGEDNPDDKASREAQTAKFLQGLCTEILALFPALAKHQHQWTSYFHTKPVDTAGGQKMPRKPDISCFKAYTSLGKWRHVNEVLTWKHLDTIIEDKKRRKTLQEFLESIVTDLYNKVYLIFLYQEDRRFVIVLSFTGDLFRVSTMDRAGVIHLGAVSYLKEPKLFLHVFIGLTFSPDVYLGYDPNFISHPLVSPQITIGGCRYTILSTVWRQDMILGRATTCWCAMYNGEEYLIKDSWVLEEQKPCEVYFLREAEGIDGVPILFDWENVMVNKRVDSTDNYWGVYRPLLNHIHRRLVFKTVGVPIWDFLTREELIDAYIDCLVSHEKLYKNQKILHCDISLYNLMIHKITRKGLLIDYDYAKDLDEGRQSSKPYPSTPEVWPRAKANENKDVTVSKVDIDDDDNDDVPDEGLTEAEILLQSEITEEYRSRAKAFYEKHGQRTGTQPFMAEDLLANEDAVHIPRFDLESFFYVLIYQCCMCQGPKGDMKDKRSTPAFLHTWLHPEAQKSEQDQGMIKKGMLNSSKELYRKLVTNHFTPYMRMFSECIVNIQQLFRNRAQIEVTHNAIIKELQAVKKFIPNEKVMPPREIARLKGVSRDRKWNRNKSEIPTSEPPPYTFTNSKTTVVQAISSRVSPSGAEGVMADTPIKNSGSAEERKPTGIREAAKEQHGNVATGDCNNFSNVDNSNITPISAEDKSNAGMPNPESEIRNSSPAWTEVMSVESSTFESVIAFTLDSQGSVITKKVVTTTTKKTQKTLTPVHPLVSEANPVMRGDKPTRILKRKSPRSSSTSGGTKDTSKVSTAQTGSNEGRKVPPSSVSNTSRVPRKKSRSS